jgi:hypothetical protein
MGFAPEAASMVNKSFPRRRTLRRKPGICHFERERESARLVLRF